MSLIDIIVGTRPNFIKVSPIIRCIESQAQGAEKLKYRLVHTGQHYDYELSRVFFDQLELPVPDINLNVEPGLEVQQISAIMAEYERVLQHRKPSLTLVVGDVNSTFACAFIAKRHQVNVAHVEAGLRSYDWSMPEEINRILTDRMSDLLFTTSKNASEILKREGADPTSIFFVGNTMIDSTIAWENKLKKPKFLDQIKDTFPDYVVLTIHRQSNVADFEKFKCLLDTVCEANKNSLVVFPTHPRVTPLLAEIKDSPQNLYIVPAQPYLEFNYLVKNAALVITDSGGVSEETTYFGVPCLTLRSNTERPETVTIGTNHIVGENLGSLGKLVQTVKKKKPFVREIPELWDGNTAKRIVDILIGFLQKNS